MRDPKRFGLLALAAICGLLYIAIDDHAAVMAIGIAVLVTVIFGLLRKPRRSPGGPLTLLTLCQNGRGQLRTKLSRGMV